MPRGTRPWTMQEMDECVNAVRAICRVDPLSLEIAAVNLALDRVEQLRTIGDDDVAASARSLLVTTVLRAVGSHHHRSADLANAILVRE